MSRLLLIDNHDSFTWNLAHQIARVSGVFPEIVANDADWDGDLAGYAAAFISPGPGTPERAEDLGHSAKLLDGDLPVLGVCLGLQALVHHHGGRVVRGEPFHGRTSLVRHDGTGLFEGLPDPLSVVRYHSLVCRDLPACIEPLAWTGDVLMAARHRTRPHFGVQFHPESILTEAGDALVRNFLRACGISGEWAAPPPRPRPPAQQTVVVRELPRAEPLDAFVHLYGASENAFWMDAPTGGRHVMGDDAGPLGGRVRYEVREPLVSLDIDKTFRWVTPLFEWLEGDLSWSRAERPAGCPAMPGYYGYLGYELKADGPDGLGPNAHASPLPDAQLVRADRLLVIEDDRAVLVALDHPKNRAWMDAIAAQWPPPPAPPVERVVLGGPPVPRIPPADYLAKIRTSQAWIADGETYELCLTNQLALDLPFRPLDAYRQLREANPAPYAAYLRFGEMAVLSTSPERFLRIDASGWAEARPIKGTARRGGSPEEDEALAARLGAGEKERAENLMIVDLLRNDLGRVCEVGSVTVPELFAVETYASVHQLVSSVQGRLRADTSPFEAVRACFPGGSMTGAPKPRTLQLIDALEGGPRGVYSGALGYIGFDGTVDLSIVIRTVVMTPEGGTVGVGGAIVALSDPEAELAEAALKAEILLEALS
ncbi:MAG: aminodeoxychorismate synthase component I [Alphaproteobacteria bacterium]|nr:aminodeoxychorismate synthase component I [Alphaproteobacteria bacterium]